MPAVVVTGHIASNGRPSDPPVLVCPCVPDCAITVLRVDEEPKCWNCGGALCEGCLETYEAWKEGKS